MDNNASNPETLPATENPTEQEPAQPFDESELLALNPEQNPLTPPDDGSEEIEAESDTSASNVDLSESEKNHIMASIETILFMSDRPVSLPKLRSLIAPETPLSIYRKLMAELRAEFAKDFRGVEIAELSLGFQLRTKPHLSSVLRKMVKTQPLKLSPTNMEVLAITAYKQPVTKDEIDQLRGVDSGYVLRNLMEKRLVRITGRSDLPGKPMVYGTTHEFRELFCLKDLSAMPALREVEAMVAASEVGTEEKMQNVMTEFGKLMANNTKVLFDDSQIDGELEALRNEIASIPTSTDFIEQQKHYQKHKDELELRLAELELRGLTLDENETEVPLESNPRISADRIIEVRLKKLMEAQTSEPSHSAGTTDEPEITEMTDSVDTIEISPTEYSSSPSDELIAAAAQAEQERHAELIEQTLQASLEESIEERIEVSIEETKIQAEDSTIDIVPDPEHNL